MDHKSIRTADELTSWLRNNSAAGVDCTGYINKYLVETVDVLLERNVGPVRVYVSVAATYLENQTLAGYLAVLNVWEGEMNFSAQHIYYPVLNGKIVGDLTTQRPVS